MRPWLVAKKPVTMAMRDEDLQALDEFALPRRLSRGDAVGVLLEERGQPDKKQAFSPPKPSPGPDLSPGDLAAAIKAEALKQALRITEKRLGVAPVEIAGDAVVPGEEPTYMEPEKLQKDEMDQSTEYDYDQGPAPDVEDQRRKGRRG